MPDEQEYTASFPVAGVNASCEYSRQPVDTTPVGENVRAYDTLAERERGGSRSGLSKFIDELVNGASVIQHLAVVVDPQNEALANAGDDIEDPSDNGRNLLDDGVTVRRVRAGGSANRHKTGPAVPALIRQAPSVGHFGGDASPSVRTLTPGLAVLFGSQLFVIVQLPGGFSSAISSVTDSAGHVYTLEVELPPAFNVTANTRLAVYRTRVTTPGALVLTVTFTGVPTVPGSIIAAIEFTGLSSSAPVLDTSRDVGTFSSFTGTVTATAPTADCSSNQNIVLGVWAGPLGTAGGSPVTSRARTYDENPAVVLPRVTPTEVLHAPATGDIFGGSRVFASRVAEPIILTGGAVVQTLQFTFAAPTTGAWLAIGLVLQKA